MPSEQWRTIEATAGERDHATAESGQARPSRGMPRGFCLGHYERALERARARARLLCVAGIAA